MTPSLLRTLLNEVYPILCAVNREHELNRLVQWTKRKKLAKPLDLYESRLADEQKRILRYRMHDPHMVSLAYLIHTVSYGVFPPPEFHRKGAASGYRYKKS